MTATMESGDKLACQIVLSLQFQNKFLFYLLFKPLMPSRHNTKGPILSVVLYGSVKKSLALRQEPE